MPTGASPSNITEGLDGNLWFTDHSGVIVRVTPATSKVSIFPIPTPDGYPEQITLGRDKNIWFTELDNNQIGRITPAGKITEFATSMPYSSPEGITAGPDGNIWFTELNSNKIGRMTPAGQVQEITLPIFGDSYSIIKSSPNMLWFVMLSIGNYNVIGVTILK